MMEHQFLSLLSFFCPSFMMPPETSGPLRAGRVGSSSSPKSSLPARMVDLYLQEGFQAAGTGSWIFELNLTAFLTGSCFSYFCIFCGTSSFCFWATGSNMAFSLISCPMAFLGWTTNGLGGDFNLGISLTSSSGFSAQFSLMKDMQSWQSCFPILSKILAMTFWLVWHSRHSRLSISSSSCALLVTLSEAGSILLFSRFLLVYSMLPTQTMMVARLSMILVRLMASGPALLLTDPRQLRRMLVMTMRRMLAASLQRLWVFIHSCSWSVSVNWQRKMLVESSRRCEKMLLPSFSLSLLSSHRITEQAALLIGGRISVRVRLIHPSFSSLLVTSNMVKGENMTSLSPSNSVFAPTTRPVSDMILTCVVLDCETLGSFILSTSLSLEATMKLLNSSTSPFLQSSSQPSLRQASPRWTGSSLICSSKLWMKRLEMEVPKKLLQCVKKLRMDLWMTWQRQLKEDSLLLWIWQSELKRASGLLAVRRWLLREEGSLKRKSSSAIFRSSPSVSAGAFSTSSNSTSLSSATLADRKFTSAPSLKKLPTEYTSAVGSKIWFITTSPLLSGFSTPKMPRISRTWNCLTFSKFILKTLLPGPGRLNSMKYSAAGLIALTTCFWGDLALPMENLLLVTSMPMQASLSVWKTSSLMALTSLGLNLSVVSPDCPVRCSKVRLLRQRSSNLRSALQLRLTSLRISIRACSSDFHRKERCSTSSILFSITRQRSNRSQLYDSALLLAMRSKSTVPSSLVSISSPSIFFLQERYLRPLTESWWVRLRLDSRLMEVLLSRGETMEETCSSRSLSEMESFSQGSTVGTGETLRLKSVKQRMWLGTNSVSTKSGDRWLRSCPFLSLLSCIKSTVQQECNINQYSHYVQMHKPTHPLISHSYSLTSGLGSLRVQYYRHMKQIWLEKYRPKTLSEVYGNAEQINTLRACVSQGTVPNLILAGPPGVGKTSSVLCIVRELLEGQFKEATLELNASDERGIDVVREQIKSFAQKKVALPPGKTKIIVLDEADSLTEGAQHALRMIISNFSETTRFVLSCNTSSKIIEPIQSRCIILRFGKLRDAEVELNLKRVVEGEDVRITEQAFKTLLFIADGDMRQAVNNIQACHFASQGQVITDDLVLHICDAPSIEDIKAILRLAEGRRIHEALRKMHEIYEQGYSVYDIVGTIHKVLLTMEEEVKREKLFEMLKFVAELRKRVLEGLATEIQLGQFLAKCASLS